MFKGDSAMAAPWQGIHRINTDVTTAETADKTVITLKTSPGVMSTAWVNFLKQRLHVHGVDCQLIGAGRIVVTSSPRAVESVVALVVSAMENTSDYIKTVLDNLRAQRLHENRDPIVAAEWRAVLDTLAAKFD
jgi:hypothetical protein